MRAWVVVQRNLIRCLNAMSDTCKAPDCDERARWPRKYCSTVCMNVGLEVAAARVKTWNANGEIRGDKDLSDDEIAAIRRRNERTHERINEKLEAEKDKHD